jgi:hypothetical protein
VCTKCWGKCWDLTLNIIVWLYSGVRIVATWHSVWEISHLMLCAYFTVTLHATVPPFPLPLINIFRSTKLCFHFYFPPIPLA